MYKSKIIQKLFLNQCFFDFFGTFFVYATRCVCYYCPLCLPYKSELSMSDLSPNIKRKPNRLPFIVSANHPISRALRFAESEGFEDTDIAYGNPTSKTLMPAGGIPGKAQSTGNRMIC